MTEPLDNSNANGKSPLKSSDASGATPTLEARHPDGRKTFLEVWWALERANSVQGGFPFLNETQRNNVTMVKEKIADYVDPPRVVPLIGPAQLHHAHYKCTVYYTERKIIGWPLPHTMIDEDAVEVLYIDHNHFHMVGNVDLGENNTHY